MATLKKQITAVYFEDSTQAVLDSSLVLDTTYSVDETSGKQRMSVANGASDLRLDPFLAGVSIDSLEHLEITSDGDIDIKVGTTSTELLPLRPATGKKSSIALSGLSLTRTATVGVFVSNASGAAVNVEFQYGGT